MDDIEKNRIDYVARLEEQVRELTRQLGEAKPLAERWTPVCSGAIAQNGDAHITLGFGGKRVTATVAAAALTAHELNDLTFSIANTLAESLLVEKIREVITPEVERLVRGASAVKTAGKW